MQTRSRNILLLAGDSPAITRTRLCAGPLTTEYTGGDLRYIRYGNVELLRRIHFAVRDHNWGTITPTLSNIQVKAAENSFQISYGFENRANDIDVAGRVRISGDASGRIEFEMDGAVRSSFLSNRIGICVLHPISCGGASVVVMKDDGTQQETQFPSSISPHQPFMNIRTLRHEFAPGVWANVAFEGDVFETEDQRNWGDASFKTYCPPLCIPFPRQVEAGDRFRQRITLTLHGLAAQAPTVVAEPQIVRLTLEADEGARLPQIGLALPKREAPLTEQQAARLRGIKPAHLRTDFDLTSTEWLSTLAYAAEQSALLGVPLEVALLVDGDSKTTLQSFAEQIARTKPAVKTFLVFDKTTHLTPPATLHFARELLVPTCPHAAFGGGTNAYFAELNRGPRAFDHLDRVSFPMNPQVHAFDELSIVETADALPDMVQSCRALVGGLPVSVTPITLKPRFNSVATAPEKAPAPDTLPSTADVRQMSLFGAAWTLSSVRALAETQVESATYYQTHGIEGVMASPDAGAMPTQFPAAPGEVYPMYHVFADLGECAAWEAVGVESSDPLAVQALVLRHGNRVRFLAANLTAEPRPIEIVGVDAAVRLRTLDERNAEFAMANPETYRSGSWQEVRMPHHGSLRITLAPYAYAMMDGSQQ